jgi:hypothetical protein
VSDNERAEQEKVAQLVTSSPVADDPLTRLWETADASHGHHMEAMTELRKRKRQEQEEPGRIRRRGRGSRHAGERVECERCRRTVARASSEPVEYPSPLDEPSVRTLCSSCADEVRRGLLPLLAGEEPLPARHQEVQEAPLTIPTRVGWWLVRMVIYALVAVVTFTLVLLIIR